MFRFAHPAYLYLLFIIPVIWGVYLYGVFRRKRNLKKYGRLTVLEPLIPDVSRYKPATKFYLQAAALFVLILVMAGPQFGSKLETVKKQGVEIMIALDADRICRGCLYPDTDYFGLCIGQNVSFFH